MSWDKAPWLMGGGIKHSNNVARLLAHLAAAGGEGIVGPRDLEVRQRATADGTIRVAPGACAVRNRNASVQYDTYVARNPTEDIATITATSGTARTDLVVARVKNPFLSGEPYAQPTAQQIADETYDPLVDTYVIENMTGPTAGSQPTLAQVRTAVSALSAAIPLASIARPAGTSTVQTAHIKDWRTMAIFSEKMVPRMVPATAATMSDATWRTIGTTTVDVPDWATHVSLRAMVAGARFSSTGSVGNLRFTVDGVATTSTPFDESTATTNDRATLMAVVTETPLTTAQRGNTITVVVQGQKNSGTTMTVAANIPVSIDVVLLAKPESNP